MKLKHVGLILTLFVGAGLAVAGCNVESNLPTGASTLNSTAAGDGLSAPIAPVATEETDCPGILEFHFRTSHPGSIEDNVVKAWIKLVGAPADATILRVWWNYGDGSGEDYDLDDLDVTENEDGTINVELLAEHKYKNLTGETARTIRAELIVAGDGTHCARVRHITVAPPPADPPDKKPAPCITSSLAAGSPCPASISLN